MKKVIISIALIVFAVNINAQVEYKANDLNSNYSNNYNYSNSRSSNGLVEYKANDLNSNLNKSSQSRHKKNNGLVEYEASPIGKASYSGTVANGYYKADVAYTNISTGHKANYLLEVKVANDRVEQIIFPNSGYIGSNSNNILKYEGGTLEVEKDYLDKVDSATTRVLVTEFDYSILIFDISLR